MAPSNYLEEARIQGNSSYYLVTAPTGEQVGINLGNGRMNIKPYISAQSGQYIGLLDNANGNPADDLLASRRQSDSC